MGELIMLSCFVSKQKAEYEYPFSNCSSAVCSSDLVEKCLDPDRGDGRKGVRYGIGKQDALSYLDGAARIDDVRDIAIALRGRGLDERYARAPEHARGIVLVEQNRADRIMAYGADALGEEQPAFVE